jgi:hypothetical protein
MTNGGKTDEWLIGGIFKEAVMAYYPDICPKELRKKTKNLRWCRHCPSQDLNQPPMNLKYYHQASLLSDTCTGWFISIKSIQM